MGLIDVALAHIVNPKLYANRLKPFKRTKVVLPIVCTLRDVRPRKMPK